MKDRKKERKNVFVSLAFIIILNAFFTAYTLQPCCWICFFLAFIAITQTKQPFFVLN